MVIEILIDISVFSIDPLPRSRDVVRETSDHVVILDGLLHHLPPLFSHFNNRLKGIENLNLKRETPIS